MSNDDRRLARGGNARVARPARDATGAKGHEALDLRARENRIEAARAALELILRGGHVALDAIERREASVRGNEDVARQLALLDAESTRELGRLEAELAGTRERTKQLEVLCNFYAGNKEGMPEPFALALAESIRALTAR